jgi:transposase-like protein
MKKRRKKHSPEFKAKVALAAVREQETVAEISRKHKIHTNVVCKWKREFLANISRVFETEVCSGVASSEREDGLLKKIGELTVERNFLSNGLERFR